MLIQIYRSHRIKFHNTQKIEHCTEPGNTNETVERERERDVQIYQMKFLSMEQRLMLQLESHLNVTKHCLYLYTRTISSD